MVFSQALAFPVDLSLAVGTTLDMETLSKPDSAVCAHSAGPWHVLNFAVFNADQSIRICDPYDATKFTRGFCGSVKKMLPIDEREANARLIAAAPDLLAVSVRCDCAFASWQIGQIPGRPEDILALITDLRAAVSKAIGGAS